jgi:hypothetical protein
MGTQDRDWLRKYRNRRAKLVWNEGRGELELTDRPKSRWRLRVPFWLRESFRLMGYLATVLVLGWIVLYLIVPIVSR